MDRIRQLSPQAIKGLSIAMFAIALLLGYLAQDAATPFDIILIVAGIAVAIVGFALWLMYGERVDAGPRR